VHLWQLLRAVRGTVLELLTDDVEDEWLVLLTFWWCWEGYFDAEYGVLFRDHYLA